MGFLFDTPTAPEIEEPDTDPALDDYRRREIERRRILSRQQMNTRDLLINPSLNAGDSSGLSNPR
jgi:hypothetical protein